MIRAVTIDLWGTLFLDGPGADEEYRGPRLAALRDCLLARGVPVSLLDLERAYNESIRELARIWRTDRDVPVRAHVANLLKALHPGLLGQLSEDALADLVKAYSSPAVVVPPAFDPAARAATDALASRGLVLCLVSNIMRTPGVVLRKLLDRVGLLE